MSDEGMKKVRIMSYAEKPSEDDNPFAVGIRDGQVVVVEYDGSDETQQWLQFTKNDDGEVERDVEGFPGFRLANKETGQMIKHAIGPHEPIQLCNGGSDHSVLWTKTHLDSDAQDIIRQFNNSDLSWDAFKGEADYVASGSKVVLWEYSGGSNQKWGIFPVEDGE